MNKWFPSFFQSQTFAWRSNLNLSQALLIQDKNACGHSMDKLGYRKVATTSNLESGDFSLIDKKRDEVWETEPWINQSEQYFNIFIWTSVCVCQLENLSK